MRNAIKNKIKILTALLVAFVLSMTMFGFTLFVGERAGAVSTGAELVSAIEAAPADYLTTTRIVIGTEGADSAEDNGQVITIESTDTDTESVTVPSGTRIVFSAVAPSAKKELEGNAIYSRIIFNVPLIVEAEAEVVFDVDVEFNAAVTVNGTMELGGETISGSGGVEVYTAVQDGVTQVYARVDGGEWQTATGGASALEGVSEAVLAQIDVLIDELSDIGDYYGQYKDFTYNGDKKGYVYQDGSLGSAVGGMVGGDLIVKLRGGRLAAVLQEGEIDMDLLGVGITGSAAMGMVYTMGGQSVTLPKV